MAIIIRPAILIAAIGLVAQPLTATPSGRGHALVCPFDHGGNRNWHAWVNAMPGPGAKRPLIVTGEVRTQAGYEGRLKTTMLDKMNPPIQHFDLSLVARKGAKAGWKTVRAEVSPGQPSYRAAIIDCDGEQLARVPVRIVQ